MAAAVHFFLYYFTSRTKTKPLQDESTYVLLQKLNEKYSPQDDK